MHHPRPPNSEPFSCSSRSECLPCIASERRRESLKLSFQCSPLVAADSLPFVALRDLSAILCGEALAKTEARSCPPKLPAKGDAEADNALSANSRRGNRRSHPAPCPTPKVLRHLAQVSARHERLTWVPICPIAEIKYANVTAAVLHRGDSPTADPAPRPKHRVPPRTQSPASGLLVPSNLRGSQRWQTRPLLPRCHSKWQRGPGGSGSTHLPNPPIFQVRHQES